MTDESGAAELRVNVLDAGEAFGEMALLTNKPRIHHHQGRDRLRGPASRPQPLLDLVREEPSAALAVAATLSRRLAGMLHQPPASRRCRRA